MASKKELERRIEKLERRYEEVFTRLKKEVGYRRHSHSWMTSFSSYPSVSVYDMIMLIAEDLGIDYFIRVKEESSIRIVKNKEKKMAHTKPGVTKGPHYGRKRKPKTKPKTTPKK